MYESFTIKNFRCFHDFTIESLGRVNLVAGKNNVGKTALLEAIFLHLGPNNPELSGRINVFRGIERLEAEEMWKWLFFGRNINETIELVSFSDNENFRRSLQIQLVEPEKSQIPAKNGDTMSIGSLTTAPWPRELVLKYEDTTGQTGTSRIFVTADEVEIARAKLSPFPLGVFLTTRIRSPKEDAERFSSLERVGRQDQVLNVLKLLEPRLRRLAVLITGGIPMIWGDIGISELVPLPLMGEGTVRLASIVLAIASAPNGTILIDEVENGLHYSVMVDVWKAIALAARQSNTQIFATTHSWECIRSAHEAFSKSDAYDFRLHRLDRIDDEIKAVTYDQETLAAALKAELEVR